jgi:hypothetical protein
MPGDFTIAATALNGAPPGWTLVAFTIGFPLWWMLVIFIIDRISILPALRAKYSGLPQEIPPLHIGSARLGGVSMNNSVRLGLSEHGVIIKSMFPFALRSWCICIPLSALESPLKRTGLFRSWITVSMRDPVVTSLSLPAWLFENDVYGMKFLAESKSP